MDENQQQKMRSIRFEIADIASTIYGAEEDLNAAEMHEYLKQMEKLTNELAALETEEN